MIDIKTQEKQAVAALAESSEVLTHVLGLRVTSPETAQQAADIAKAVRDKRRTIEAERDGMAKPLRKIATKISALFKKPIDQLAQCEGHLKHEVQAFHAAEAAKATAALAEATTHEEIIATVAAVAPKTEGMSMRETWGFKVTDRSKIPAEYFLLDEARLAIEAKDMKAGLKIPGIEPVRGTTAVLR